MKQSDILLTEIKKQLGHHPWGELIHVMDTTVSTNDDVRVMAQQGAPAGTTLIALEQTGGRGRQGRSFSSPEGQGLYFSLLLRPKCAPGDVSHITAMVAVAACDAVASTTGIRPQIKWTNDLVLNQKKIAGILCEMDADFSTNTINSIILGIGINLNQRYEDFPSEIQNIATSLRMVTRQEQQLPPLAAALVQRLAQMSSSLLTHKELWIQRYRQDCLTLGKEIKIIRGDLVRYGWAMDVAPDGGLVVRYADGSVDTVSSGEVSVRGLYGYL